MSLQASKKGETPINKPIYIISRFVFLVFAKIIGKLKVYGRENIPATGGVIIAPNHQSNLDPPVIGAAIRRFMHFMAKEELFANPTQCRWMHAVGAFPVRRGTADRKAIKKAFELLAAGEMVTIFPEGTRSVDGNLQPAELGIGMFALKSRVPVVPTAVIGTREVIPSGGGLHFHQIKVIYGKPLTFPDLYDAKESKEAMEEIGRRVMAAIAELMSEYKDR